MPSASADLKYLSRVIWGDLFRIRGFSPITGLIAFFFKASLLLSFLLCCKFPANFHDYTSLFTIITILSSLTDIAHFGFFVFLNTHTLHLLCNWLLSDCKLFQGGRMLCFSLTMGPVGYRNSTPQGWEELGMKTKVKIRKNQQWNGKK